MGTLDEFVAERAPVWTELERLVDNAGSKPSRLGADGVRRLGTTYRATAADLAIARRQFPGDPLLGRLERLVLRARTAVYHTARGTRDVPRVRHARLLAPHPRAHRARRRSRSSASSDPALLGGYWAWRDPGAAIGVVPGQFQYVAEPRTRGEDWGVAFDDQAAFSSEIFTNNIRVAILAFAGGILLGVGALFMLLYNGLILGRDVRHRRGGRQRPTTLPTGPRARVPRAELHRRRRRGRAAHGLGDHRSRDRAHAVSRCARKRAPPPRCCSGTAAWLVVAGLVEGFVTPSGQSLDHGARRRRRARRRVLGRRVLARRVPLGPAGSEAGARLQA